MSRNRGWEREPPVKRTGSVRFVRPGSSPDRRARGRPRSGCERCRTLDRVRAISRVPGSAVWSKLGADALRHEPGNPSPGWPRRCRCFRVPVDRVRAPALERTTMPARPVPRFVERELRGFLRCGILAHGFVRVHCDACGLDRVVALSCKGRGFCPSSRGTAHGQTPAAHLVDRVLPEVPVRQWVLSLPFALRYRLAYDAALTSAALGVFVRTVFGSSTSRAQAVGRSARAVRCGHIRAALRGRSQSERPLPLAAARRRLRARAGRDAALPPPASTRGCRGRTSGAPGRPADRAAARPPKPGRAVGSRRSRPAGRSSLTRGISVRGWSPIAGGTMARRTSSSSPRNSRSSSPRRPVPRTRTDPAA